MHSRFLSLQSGSVGNCYYVELGHFTQAIRRFRTLSERKPDIDVGPGVVVYGNQERRTNGKDHFVPWHALDGEVPVQP